MFSLILILLALCGWTQSQIQLNQPYAIALRSSSNLQYITTLRIQGTSLNHVSNENHLIIEVQCTDVAQYFEIRMLVVKTEPIGYCRGARHISCLIDSSGLKKGEEVNIKIQGNGQGNYVIVAYRNQFQDLKQGYIDLLYDKFVGKHYRIKFQPDFKLPQSIRILLSPAQQNSFSHISARTNISSYHDNIDSINMWQGIQGIFLTKKQFIEQRIIYLTVIGEIDTKYTLQYEVLQNQHHDLEIGQKLDQFIGKSGLKDYHIKLGNILNEEIVINFQIFSGSPAIIFYSDNKMKKLLKSKQFQYMADSRFTFTDQQLKDGRDLYCRIRSNDHDSIFRMEIKKIRKESAQLLMQNSYNFISITHDKYLYLYLQPEENKVQSVINVSISVMNVLGNSRIALRLGDSKSLTCLPGCLQKNFQTVPFAVSSIGLKIVYKVSIPVNLTSQASILLLTMFKSSNKNPTQQVNIEYSFEGKLITLRQNYPLTQIIERNQLKHYKYSPLQKSKNVQICASPISGKVGVMGSYKDPITSSPDSITAKMDCVTFNSTQIKKTVFISVYGISKSKYSISVQVGHSQQVVITPALQTNEDVEYKVTITPLGSYVFILHPIYPHLRANYNASQPMRICLLNTSGNGQSGCDQEFTRENQIAGQFYNKLSTTQPARLQVTNLSPTNSLSFRLKYHSGDYSHCELKLMNKIYEQLLLQNSCFEFQLPSQSVSDYQIITKQMYAHPQSIAVGLCGKQVAKYVSESVVQVTRQQIKTFCNGTLVPKIQVIAQVSSKVDVSYILQYIVQGISELVYLPANLRFADHAIISETDPIRQFVLETYEENIFILIKQRSSAVLLRASVYIEQKSNLFNENTYKNLKPVYVKEANSDLEISFIIFGLDIGKGCNIQNKGDRKECEVIVVLQPIERKNVGKELEYTIQFKNANAQIKEYQPETFQLGKGQITVYNFFPSLDQPKPSNYSCAVQLTTHNQPCARLYVNRFDQAGRQSAIINSIESANIFTIDSNAYILTVQGLADNCQFSLQLIMLNQKSNTSMIKVLHAGYGLDISIGEDQVQYFIMSVHQSDSWKKVYYLRKFGDIRMYGADYQGDEKILKNGSYSFLETDFRYTQNFPNILEIPMKGSGIYILAVKGQSYSQGTLLLLSSDQPITIPLSKKVQNQIMPRTTSTIKFYAPKTQLKSGEVSIDLIYGIVEVHLAYVSKNQLSDGRPTWTSIPVTKQMCCKIGKLNVIPFNFGDVASAQYLQVKITNMAEDEVIFQVSVNLDAIQVSTEDIDKDRLTHIQLSKQEKTAIKSKVTRKQHKIIISSFENNQSIHSPFNSTRSPYFNSTENKTQNSTQISSQLKCLQITVPDKLKEHFILKEASIVLDNVLMIVIEWVMFKEINLHASEDLQLDVKIKQECSIDNFTISITPSLDDRLTILAPWRWFYFTKERNFAVASKKQFLVDIISCSGPSSLKVAKTFSSLYSNNESYEKTSFIATQPHVFRVTPSQSISYLKLQSEQATIRLITPDFDKETGIGYLKYKWDYFLYETDFQKLTLYLEPLKAISETKTKITLMQYVVRVIGGVNLIHSSAQCLQVGNKTAYFNIINAQKGKQTQVIISKQQLLESMNGDPEKLYLAVDFIVSIQTPEGLIEVYKFLAPAQQIPIDIFSITKLNNKIIAFGILTILAVIFGCLGLAQCFLKYIVPILGRISRNNQLVQEQNHAPEQPMENLPAVSDRNDRGSTQLDSERAANPATQDKMDS